MAFPSASIPQFMHDTFIALKSEMKSTSLTEAFTIALNGDIEQRPMIVLIYGIRLCLSQCVFKYAANLILRTKIFAHICSYF